jgi:hypothetical protein
MDVWELYDLEADPNEMNNIYADAPKSVVSRLKSELDSIREFYQDDQTLAEMKLMTDTVITRVYNEPLKMNK